ncbi:MAG: AAA family ATPase [Treponema sp.]|nr:AAA family ATPase [Treponema sp.]
MADEYYFEKSVLGSILQGADIPDELTDEMFLQPRNKIIFQALKQIKKQCAPDIVILHEHFMKDGKKDNETGGPSYYGDLTSGVIIENIEYYAHSLIEKYRSNKIESAIKQAAENIGNKDIDEVVQQLKTTLSSQEKARQKNVIHSATEILGMVFPAIQWIIYNFLAPGLTILSGAEKLGKSWLAMGLGISLALGTYVLGKIKVDKTAVLYLCLEDNSRRLQRRLNQLQAGNIPNLYFADKWIGGVPALETYLKDNPSIRLVIIDTFIKFFPTIDLKDYTEISNKLTQLKNIADSLDIGIIIIHHTRKGSNNKESGGDWMDNTLGSKAINGTADATITLKRGRGNRQGELNLTGRDIEEQELILTFDPDCNWTIAGDKNEIQESDTRQLIFDWLRENGGNGPSAIHKGLKKEGYAGSLSTIQNILIKMVNSGILQNLAGTYLVSSTPSMASMASTSSIPSIGIEKRDHDNHLKKPIEVVETVEEFDIW